MTTPFILQGHEASGVFKVTVSVFQEHATVRTVAANLVVIEMSVQVLVDVFLSRRSSRSS